MDELLADIEAGKLPAVIVLASDHAILIDRVIAALREAAVAPATRAFNYDVIEGKPSAARIITLAQTLPMMAPRRLVYVRDLAGLPTEEADEFLQYVASPNPSTVLVAVTSKLDKRLKLYAALGKKGALAVLTPPKQLAPWVRAEAKRAAVTLEPGAVERLLHVIGDDVSRISVAVEQLGLFVGGRAVTAADVDELIADTRERSVFELTDAIAAGNLTAAMRGVAALLEQRESAIGVIAMLARFIRQLVMVHEGRAAGISKSEMYSKLGLPPFLADKLITASRNYALPALRTVTTMLADADRSLKGDPTVAWSGQELAMFGLPSGPAVKTLGRDLAERSTLEALVQRIVGFAS